jgi:hypothetical protein
MDQVPEPRNKLIGRSRKLRRGFYLLDLFIYYKEKKMKTTYATIEYCGCDQRGCDERGGVILYQGSSPVEAIEAMGLARYDEVRIEVIKEGRTTLYPGPQPFRFEQ